MDESQKRDVLEKYIREHTLGPGFAKEIFLCKDDCSDEILDKDPTRCYITGILVPAVKDDNDDDSNDMDDLLELEELEQQGQDDENPDEVAPDNEDEDNEDDDEDFEKSDHDDTHDDRFQFNTDHIGLVACVPENTSSVHIDIKYAKYSTIKNEDKKNVRLHVGYLFGYIDRLLECYQNNTEFSFKVDGQEPRNTFASYIQKDDETKTIWVEHNLSIEKRPEKIIPDENEERVNLIKLNNLFRRLFRTLYKREEYHFGLDLNVQKEEKDNHESISADAEIRYKIFVSKGKKYVKLLLQNKCEVESKKAKYLGCLFQPEMKLTPKDSKLISYSEPISFDQDREGKIIDLVYRNISNYGKGICCAVEWDKDGEWIKTSFMPTTDVKKFSSQFDEKYCTNQGPDIDANAVNDCCKLFNISHWNTNNVDIISRLRTFVEAYSKWCAKQQERAKSLSTNDQAVAKNIIDKQQELLVRLKDNVNYLDNNLEALTCFKYANTAMLIQMMIARDPHFKKNRDSVGEGQDILKSLRWFRDNGQDCKYYPFQLAFLLMNVKSTFVDDDKYHNNVVDMIWFPTGGGKTEAYLALTALTIIARRRSSDNLTYTSGISVIMRYTLRLLTSQQFERASYLICALNFMRRKLPDARLGDTISIGLWIGNSDKANFAQNKKWGKFLNSLKNGDLKKTNPFPITYCPWCGQKLVNNVTDGYIRISPNSTPEQLQRLNNVFCLNQNCRFNDERDRNGDIIHNDLPIYFVDETIKNKKPTLLFATVDKLAQLYSSKVKDMFGYGNGNVKSPDLIIQDELHLISGPLGSIVGFFELAVEKMASKGDRKPKIIASTATTRNTDALIKSLYNREGQVFPAQGITYDDNFFSHVETESLRRHLGLCPQGFSSPVFSEVHLIAQLILGKIVLFKTCLEKANVDINNPQAVANYLDEGEGKLKEELDLYWTLVLYYNSLKDLGRTHSRIAGIIRENIRAQVNYLLIPPTLDFMIEGVDKRVKEFTSREDSSKIKDLLNSAESTIELERDNSDILGVKGNMPMDIVLASNMISVGIDINRWNVMMMSGQPRSTSEYIQSSSRVGRSHKGLVVNLYSPLRIREFSMFENFTSYHESYYKYVEPLSATPITIQILKQPILKNLIKCYKDYFALGLEQTDAVNTMISEMTTRFHLDDNLAEYARAIIDDLWNDNTELNKTASSLRDIDQDKYIQIDQLNYQ